MEERNPQPVIAIRQIGAAIVLLLAALIAFLTSNHYLEHLDLRRQTEALRGNAIDIGFLQHMSLHHDQAIALAQILLDERLSSDPSPSRLRAFALSISTAQLYEVGKMRGWLELWGEPVYPESLSMNWMLLAPEPLDEGYRQYLLDCANSELGMPGLVANSQLDILRKLDRDARDRLFLELMLRHHEGGLPMARFAAHHAELGPVRTLAQRMVQSQFEEVAAIKMALQERGAAKRVFP